ncbi:hypothetical protein D3C72_1820510 [compost metagenome]
MEHFQGQLDAFAHRTDAFVVRAGQFQATLQAVDDRQQVAGEFFQRELVSLLHILLGATADVLQIGGYTQSLILSACQLLFEHLYTSRQVITRSLGRLVGVWVLRIHCLFVSHRFLLSISSASSTRASAQLYGAAKSGFKGRR